MEETTPKPEDLGVIFIVHHNIINFKKFVAMQQILSWAFFTLPTPENTTILVRYKHQKHGDHA